MVARQQAVHTRAVTRVLMGDLNLREDTERGRDEWLSVLHGGPAEWGADCWAEAPCAAALATHAGSTPDMLLRYDRVLVCSAHPTDTAARARNGTAVPVRIQVHEMPGDNGCSAALQGKPLSDHYAVVVAVELPRY